MVKVRLPTKPGLLFRETPCVHQVTGMLSFSRFLFVLRDVQYPCILSCWYPRVYYYRTESSEGAGRLGEEGASLL